MKRITDLLPVKTRCAALVEGFEPLTTVIPVQGVVLVRGIVSDHQNQAGAEFVLVKDYNRYYLYRRGVRPQLCKKENYALNEEKCARSWRCGAKPVDWWRGFRQAVDRAYWRMVKEQRIVHVGISATYLEY